MKQELQKRMKNNWKIIGRALATTIGLFIVITAITLLILKCPIWLTAVVGFVVVFALIYDSMKRYYYNGNDNDRMSWNNDYDEEDEEENK